MNKEQLFECMSDIDDDIIALSETYTVRKSINIRKWIAAAACFCVVIIGAAAAVHTLDKEALLLNDHGTEGSHLPHNDYSDESEHTDGPAFTWNVIYNEVEQSGVITDSARVRQYAPGHFTEPLSDDEIAATEPGMKLEWMKYSGIAHFDGEGNLLNVNLSVTTTDPENSVTVIISKESMLSCYSPDTQPETSLCGDVEYTVWQNELIDGRTALEADSLINGIYYNFSAVSSSSEDIARLKADFEDILECFTWYSAELNQPDLSAVTAEYIPEWFDRTLTLSEACDDPDFGAYMLRELPDGFSAEAIRRYKDQNNDYLSGLWSSGYNEIRWRVSCITENDERRLTSVADTENYDLALYPIPRAESVPDELREIVDDPVFDIGELTPEAVRARAYRINDAGDSKGWRMDLSVRYGDIIVKISTKGVSPEWMFEQLTAIGP